MPSHGKYAATIRASRVQANAINDKHTQCACVCVCVFGVVRVFRHVRMSSGGRLRGRGAGDTAITAARDLRCGR